MWPLGSGSRDRLALVLAVLAPFAVSVVLVPVRDDFDNTQIALVLVVVVVAVAAYGNRVAGYVAALSAGLWFDFFFTRPYERFTITRRSDIETFVLLLVVGLTVTELAVWGRRQQALVSRQAGYLAGIHAAAESGATGAILQRIDQGGAQPVDRHARPSCVPLPARGGGHRQPAATAARRAGRVEPVSLGRGATWPPHRERDRVARRERRPSPWPIHAHRGPGNTCSSRPAPRRRHTRRPGGRGTSANLTSNYASPARAVMSLTPAADTRAPTLCVSGATPSRPASPPTGS